MIKYIAENYEEYFNDFYERFDKSLEPSLEEISELKLDIQFKRFKKSLEDRRKFLRNYYKEKGEIENEK